MDWMTLALGFLGGIVFTIVVAAIGAACIYKASKGPRIPMPPK